MPDDAGVSPLPAEARARLLIDQQLTQAGWQVQNRKDLNLFAGQGIAVRGVVMKPGHGRVDYLLYVEKAVVAPSSSRMEPGAWPATSCCPRRRRPGP